MFLLNIKQGLSIEQTQHKNGDPWATYKTKNNISCNICKAVNCPVALPNMRENLLHLEPYKKAERNATHNTKILVRVSHIDTQTLKYL